MSFQQQRLHRPLRGMRMGVGVTFVGSNAFRARCREVLGCGAFGEAGGAQHSRPHSRRAVERTHCCVPRWHCPHTGAKASAVRNQCGTRQTCAGHAELCRYLGKRVLTASRGVGSTGAASTLEHPDAQHAAVTPTASTTPPAAQSCPKALDAEEGMPQRASRAPQCVTHSSRKGIA